MEDPAPALREVEDLERHRNNLTADVSGREGIHRHITPRQHHRSPRRKMLRRGIARNIDALNRETLKHRQSNLIDQITLDPVSHECRISMNLRNEVTSARGVELYKRRGDRFPACPFARSWRVVCNAIRGACGIRHGSQVQPHELFKLLPVTTIGGFSAIYSQETPSTTDKRPTGQHPGLHSPRTTTTS